jgi:hypothetical protein
LPARGGANQPARGKVRNQDNKYGTPSVKRRGSLRVQIIGGVGNSYQLSAFSHQLSAISFQLS